MSINNSSIRIIFFLFYFFEDWNIIFWVCALNAPSNFLVSFQTELSSWVRFIPSRRSYFLFFSFFSSDVNPVILCKNSKKIWNLQNFLLKFVRAQGWICLLLLALVSSRVSHTQEQGEIVQWRLSSFHSSLEPKSFCRGKPFLHVSVLHIL